MPGKSIQVRLHEKRPRRGTLQQVKNEQARQASSIKNYDTEWRRLRAAHLRDHPYCQCSQCQLAGRQVKATQVDHIVPHRGDDRLRLDPCNLMSMYHAHHSKKTATYDGGFGNKRRRRDV